MFLTDLVRTHSYPCRQQPPADTASIHVGQLPTATLLLRQWSFLHPYQPYAPTSTREQPAAQCKVVSPSLVLEWMSAPASNSSTSPSSAAWCQAVTLVVYGGGPSCIGNPFWAVSEEKQQHLLFNNKQDIPSGGPWTVLCSYDPQHTASIEHTKQSCFTIKSSIKESVSWGV